MASSLQNQVDIRLEIVSQLIEGKVPELGLGDVLPHVLVPEVAAARISDPEVEAAVSNLAGERILAVQKVAQSDASEAVLEVYGQQGVVFPSRDE